jgi:hypothetical protein
MSAATSQWNPSSRQRRRAHTSACLSLSLSLSIYISKEDVPNGPMPLTDVTSGSTWQDCTAHVWWARKEGLKRAVSMWKEEKEQHRRCDAARKETHRAICVLYILLYMYIKNFEEVTQVSLDVSSLPSLSLRVNPSIKMSDILQKQQRVLSLNRA